MTDAKGVRWPTRGKVFTGEKPMEQNTIASFFVQAGFPTVALDESRVGLLQDLHERCRDFITLATGQPPPPNAASLLLTALPPGKSAEDKVSWGLPATTAYLWECWTSCGATPTR
jgi:hypothetical protein